MSIASEITRLQGVKADIIQAITDKGVTVPTGSALDDCPGLIADIPSGPSYKVIGGKEYRTVVMPDGKEWLAENLDFKFCEIGGSGTPTAPNAWYYVNNESTYGWEGKKYGLLYNWYAVKILNDNRSDLIPGWHVPSTTEWDTLATACGGASTCGTRLKSITDWTSGDGTDAYGFTSFPSGYYSGSFDGLGSVTPYWSSTEQIDTTAYRIRLNTGTELNINPDIKTNALSLRLVRDT